MKFKALYFALFAIVCNQSIAVSPKISDNPKYSCPKGFQLVNTRNSTNCVQPERVSYRAPIACRHSNNANNKFVLRIDHFKLSDHCVTAISKATQSTNNQSPSFSPKCHKGFKLSVRRGKDACTTRILKRVQKAKITR